MSVTISSTLEAQAQDAALSKQAQATEVEPQESESTQTSDEQDETQEASDTSSEELENDLSADSSDSEDDEELKDEQKEEQRPRKKGGFQKRIDKLTREKILAAEEIQYWKEQALKGQKAEQQDQPKAQEQKATSTDKPKAEDFETHADYVEAVAEWKLDQREKKASEQRKLDEQKAEQLKIQVRFQESVKKAQSETPDFNDVIKSIDHIPLSPTLQNAIRTSDDGAKLLYELAKNPDLIESINSMSNEAAYRAIGKFEGTLNSSKSTKETKIVTKAPAPISAIGKGVAPIQKSLSDPNLSFAEYEKLRKQQLKNK